jgi:hypothetical protein
MTSKDSKKSSSENLPRSAACEEALAYFHVQKQKPVRIILPFISHKPSKWKTTRIEEALEYQVTLITKILRQWEEDPATVKHDGAIALILSMQEPIKAKFKSRTLGNEIRKRFPQEAGTPFLSRLHESVCRDAARAITGWTQKKIKAAAEQMKAERASDTSHIKPFPTEEDVYRVWQAQEQAYQQAATRIIEFGRNRGDTLQEHGRREARWILEKLLPEEEIKQLLDFIEQLLDEERRQLDGTVGLEEHPWLQLAPDRDELTHHRAVRESRLMQRILEPRGDLVLLGMLHPGELEQLGKELRQMRGALIGFKAAVLEIHAALEETHAASAELRELQRDLQTFLVGRPEPYPTTVRSHVTEDFRQKIQETYETWLSWFILNKDKLGSAQKFLDEREEQRSVQGLLTSMSILNDKERQVLSLIGAARPGQYRDFALLYDRTSYRCTLALMLHKPGAFGNDHEVENQRWQDGHRKNEQKRYVHRQQKNPLYYVNFPLTPFKTPKGTSVLLFPLDFGDDYQNKFLRNIIRQQLRQQKMEYISNNEEKRIEKCLPPAIAKSAKLICDWDKDHKITISVHVSFELPAPELRPIPERVIGIHERDGVYYYAVSGFDGIIRGSGKIMVDPHVRPELGARLNTENYVIAVADAIIARAKLWQAHIGIEDTVYRKSQPSLSRDRNRRIFRLPSGRILETLKERCRQQGVLAPEVIDNISPFRDCSVCRKRTKIKRGLVRQVIITFCPHCHAWQEFSESLSEMQCYKCQYTLRRDKDGVVKEHVFSCPMCGIEELAWRNTVIVVAHRTLVELVDHHRNALIHDRKRKNWHQKEGDVSGNKKERVVSEESEDVA